MPDTEDKPAPGLTARAAADRQARMDREAAALRENLRRRKQQSRARAAPETPAPAPPAPPGEPKA